MKYLKSINKTYWLFLFCFATNQSSLKNEIRSTYIRFVALLKHGDQKPLMYPHQKKNRERKRSLSCTDDTCPCSHCRSRNGVQWRGSNGTNTGPAFVLGDYKRSEEKLVALVRMGMGKSLQLCSVVSVCALLPCCPRLSIGLKPVSLLLPIMWNPVPSFTLGSQIAFSRILRFHFFLARKIVGLMSVLQYYHYSNFFGPRTIGLLVHYHCNVTSFLHFF